MKVKPVAKALLVGSLVLMACSSGGRIDTAFEKLDGALPAELQRVDHEGEIGYRSARYQTRGEPHEVAAVVRSSLVSQGFTLFDGSGLPDRSVVQPSVPQPSMPSGSTPANLGPHPSSDPPAVDAIQIRGFRGEPDLGMMRSIYFHPGPRPGWTVVVVTAAPQD